MLRELYSSQSGLPFYKKPIYMTMVEGYVWMGLYPVVRFSHVQSSLWMAEICRFYKR